MPAPGAKAQAQARAQAQADKAAAELLQEEQAAAESAERAKQRGAAKKARQKQRKQVGMMQSPCAQSDAHHLMGISCSRALVHVSLLPAGKLLNLMKKSQQSCPAASMLLVYHFLANLRHCSSLGSMPTE